MRPKPGEASKLTVCLSSLVSKFDVGGSRGGVVLGRVAETVDCVSFHPTAECLATQVHRGLVLEAARIPCGPGHFTADKQDNRFRLQISDCLLGLCRYYIFNSDIRMHTDISALNFS